MKCILCCINNNTVASPPSRGAWIEMSRTASTRSASDVAPLAGGVD